MNSLCLYNTGSDTTRIKQIPELNKRPIQNDIFKNRITPDYVTLYPRKQFAY